MNFDSADAVVLALYPITRGVAFALMKSPVAPIDWGIKGVEGRDRHASSLEQAAALIKRGQPDAIVLEEPTAPRLSRARGLERLINAIEGLGQKEGIDVYQYPRSAVQDCFSQFGARTRYEIAATIAARVPALERFLPPPRKLWESEDSRMGIFRAAALALTHYDLQARDAIESDWTI
jgi:hypothetical protein